MANWREISNKDGIITRLNMDDGTIHTHQLEVASDVAKMHRDIEFENSKFKKSTQDHMHLIAEIPTTVYEDLHARGIWQDEERKAIWLASDEAAIYRTSVKDVGRLNGNRRMV